MKERANVEAKHLDGIDMKKIWKEAMVASFEPLLASYAKSRNLKRDGNCMGGVEDALQTLVMKGAGLKYPDSVLVALAGVARDRAILKPFKRVAESVECEVFLAVAAPDFPSSKRCGATVREGENKAVDLSVEWLMTNPERQILPFWKRWRHPRPTSFSRHEAKELLRRLLEEYFPS